MSLLGFIKKQFIDVISWTEEGDGVLSYRYPMQDAEIQYGGQLTVRESQLALFVNEGKIADEFEPGLYTLETHNLPLLTNLKNWDKLFKSPFKSDVYFFSTRLQINQRWGTQNPITIRDRDFGMIRLRGYGVYAYRVVHAEQLYKQLSGTLPVYTTTDLDGYLRDTLMGKVSDTFAESNTPFLDMAANLNALSAAAMKQVSPVFEDLGLELHAFQVQNLSLPDELQKKLDERIGMNMVGNLRDYTQYQMAQAIPIAAANEGGGAGLGAGLGAGMAMGKAMTDAMAGGGAPAPAAQAQAAAAAQASPSSSDSAPAAGDPHATKFCMDCGKPIARAAKFCPECGGTQS